MPTGLWENLGGPPTVALQIAVAAALLMLGRRIYWVFVAGVGFLVAMRLVGDVMEPQQEWVTLALAIVAGLVGALLAVFLQKLAIGLAGFFATAYLVGTLAPGFGLDGSMLAIVMVVCGVIGAILAGVLFDWALIILSSLAGAALLVDALNLEQTAGLVVMLVVAVAGISIQANLMHRDRAKDR
jgi:hypothetical protein